MPITNVDDIVTRLIAVLSAETSAVTAKPGSVIHSAFILPSATALSWDSSMLTLTQAMYSLTRLLALSSDTNFQTSVAEALAVSVVDVQHILSTAIERIGANYGLTRKGPSAAYGTVYFYTTSAPGSDQSISASTITTNTGVAFTTSDTTVLPADNIAAYYDPVLAAYSVAAAVTAVAAGSSGRVGANTLVNATGLPAGFSVTNKYAIETGYDTETDAELVARIQTTLQGISLQTAPGIKATIMNNLDVRQVLVADAQSPYQLRNNGKGGVVDIYVMDMLPVEATQVMTYNGNTVFNLQPVLDIVSIVDANNTSLVEGTDYALVTDTNPLTMNSTRAIDRVVWLPGGTAPVGSTTVTYVYNQMLHNVSNFITADAYKPLMGDVTNSVLVRSGNRIDLEIGFQVVTYGNYRASRSSILSSATAAIEALVNATGFGASIAESDIIAVIEAVPGVNYVPLTPTAFNIVGQAIPALGVITAGGNEYLRVSSVILS